jgi:hypothetical protein
MTMMAPLRLPVPVRVRRVLMLLERWLDMDDKEKEGHESTFHQNLILSALSLIFCSGRTIPHQEISGG